jgi:hypothetical protein
MIMSTDIAETEVSQHELEELIAKLMRGERDEDAALRSCERMDRMREETHARVGLVDVSVDFIRELRDR